MILDSSRLQAYAERFNACDEEITATSIPNRHAGEWMEKQIPRLDCPDKDIEETYYFRWWVYRKHLKETPGGHIVTEFLPDVPWAGKYNAISCAAGHHLYEGRWIQDAKQLFEYVRFWYRGGGSLQSYSNWIPDGLYQLCLTTGDFDQAIDLLPDLVADEQRWERDHLHGSGLYWSSDDRDGSEFSISGPGLRTTLNCYQYANTNAIAKLAKRAGNDALHERYRSKADTLKRLILDRLWDEERQFFLCVPLQDRETPVDRWSFADMKPSMVARELWGYLPWYFGIAGKGYEKAWGALFDADGFHGEYGPTTAERSHQQYGIFYSGDELTRWLKVRSGDSTDYPGEKGHECLWNGPSWPFATAQVLTALANHLVVDDWPAVSADEYVRLLARYARSHRRTRANGTVVPWIDENLHPDTGDWISRTRLKTWSNGTWDPAKGGRERGKDYNHSTFCDLVISGLFGIRPLDKGVEIHPLFSTVDWPYACLDGVSCRGHLLTVIYDQDGTHYDQGKGYQVLVDGTVKVSLETPGPCLLAI